MLQPRITSVNSYRTRLPFGQQQTFNVTKKTHFKNSGSIFTDSATHCYGWHYPTVTVVTKGDEVRLTGYGKVSFVTQGGEGAEDFFNIQTDNGELQIYLADPSEIDAFKKLAGLEEPVASRR